MTTTKEPEAGVRRAAEKICHPSVCVGEAEPTSCVCPVTSKK